MNKYVRSDGKYIYAEADYIEMYIPMYYFLDTFKFAEILGDHINALCVFDVGFFDGNGNLKEMKVMNLPTFTDLFIVDYEIKPVQLPATKDPVNCMVLKYNKGHTIMNSSTVQDSDNAESYLYFILRGKVPPTVPYEKSLELWRKNQEINGVHLGVPSVVEQVILSVMYRYKNDPGTKFSHVIGQDGNVSQYDYIMNNIRQICQYTSTFTGLTFEDMDSMITTSLNRTRTHGEESYSPVEVLLKL